MVIKCDLKLVSLRARNFKKCRKITLWCMFDLRFTFLILQPLLSSLHWFTETHSVTDFMKTEWMHQKLVKLYSSDKKKADPLSTIPVIISDSPFESSTQLGSHAVAGQRCSTRFNLFPDMTLSQQRPTLLNCHIHVIYHWSTYEHTLTLEREPSVKRASFIYLFPHKLTTTTDTLGQ